MMSDMRLPEKWSSAVICNATALRKASRRVTQLYDDVLLPLNLRSTQFAILAELSARESVTSGVQELANALVTERTSLLRALRPLERDCLVSVKADINDRRRRLISLTEKGRKTLRDAEQLWAGAQDRFGAILGRDEVRKMREALLKIAYNEDLAKLRDAPQDR